MFKFSPQKIISLILSILFSVICHAQVNQQDSILSGNELAVYNSALIESVIDDQNILTVSDSKKWDIGEIVPIVSQNAKLGVFAFAEVTSVKVRNSKYEVRVKLIRQSRRFMIQKGDYIKRINLSEEDKDYIGTTDLLIKSTEKNISSKYRPVVYQGFFIGETAQVLYKNEFLLNVLGNLQYGVYDWLTLSTFTTLNVLGGPNASFKARFYDSESTTLSAGLSFVRLLNIKNQATLNLNMYWDSTSSDSLISHTFLGLGLIQWDGAADASAIKALGSSSFQSGYELIMSNWDRFLIGPSYNFEKKSLGGYLSYMWIYDRFHLQVALNATDITKFRYDAKDGYFLNFDLFWRF